MAIERFDYNKCIGCGVCMNACTCDVIRMDEAGKPYIKYPDECCVCLYCMEDCPVDAVFVSPYKYLKQKNAWG